MKMKVTIYTALLAGIALASSCKKDDKNNTSAGNIPKGQCSISFNTDKEFGGTTSISIGPNQTSLVTMGAQGNKTNISFAANNADPMNLKSVMFTLLVPQGATTTNGNLSGKFDGQSTDEVNTTMSFSATTNATNTTSYGMKTGTVTITKLNADEIEGNFSGTGETSTGTSIVLSNGKFAAKFK